MQQSMGLYNQDSKYEGSHTLEPHRDLSNEVQEALNVYCQKESCHSTSFEVQKL